MDLASKPILSRENSLSIQKKPFVPSASTARIISSIRTAAKAIKFIEFSKSGENGSLNIFKAFKPLKGKHGRPSVVESHHLEEPVDINNTEHEKLVVDILQVKPENRYEEELSFLRKAFKDIEVFQQLECDMDSSSFAKVFRALRLQTAKAGEKVINIGDFGKTYYMIIKGSVSVVLKSEKMGEKRRDNKNISPKKANEKDKMNEYVAAFLREEEQKQNKANKDGGGSTSAFWFVKNLNQGQAFGELALSKGSNRKRTATVICKEDCIFAILTYNDYYTLLGDIYERRIVENMSLLSSVDIFESWKDYEISFFASSLNEAKYTRNQVLFRQGENPDFVYFIKSGEVELKKNICREKGAETNFKHWKKNDSIRLAMLMKGGYFGEGEVITADTREYTASIYSSEAKLLYMDREQFLNFCRGKRRFEALQKAILERKLARQELISKLIGSRDQLTETVSSQNIKFQQYFSSDPIPGFYQSLSPFQKHLLAGDTSPTKANSNHLPEVASSNQSSRSSSLEKSSPRRYEKPKPKGPVSKIFSSTFLNQTQKNEKKPRIRGESPTASRIGSKLLDRSSFLNTQTSIFSPRDEVDPVMTKIQSAPDPYSIFKLSKIYHTETLKNVPSVSTLDISPKNNKPKDKKPMIKLIKSLGLDRIYEEIGSQTERVGSKTYFNLQSLQPIPETEDLKKTPSIDLSNPDKYQLPSTLSALDNSPRRHESVKTRSVSPKMIQKFQKSLPKKFSVVAIAANENPYG